jgi:hypothetical protein
MSDTTNFEGLASRPTRRQAIVSVATALGGLALGSTKAWAGAEEEISHTAESIHQEALFKANRKRVYEALIDTKQFDKVIELSGVMKSPAPGIQQAHGDQSRSGRCVRTLRRVYNGPAHRACAERANRPSLASGQLGSRHLFNCGVRAGGAGLRDQDRL